MPWWRILTTIILCVAFGLFAVERGDVLEKGERGNWRKVSDLVWLLTFDQGTKSFAVSSKSRITTFPVASSGNPQDRERRRQLCHELGL